MTVLGCMVAAALAVFIAALGVGPHLLPYKTYAILGGSMEPTIHLGSEAVLVPVRADRLKVGDVITFHHPVVPGELVTHRIFKVVGNGKKRYFLTKGDANSVPDAWRVPVTGTGWRYSFSIPYAGYLVVYAGSAIARFLILAAVGLAVGVGILRRVWTSEEATA
jgi:signal peptidase